MADSFFLSYSCKKPFSPYFCLIADKAFWSYFILAFFSFKIFSCSSNLSLSRTTYNFRLFSLVSSAKRLFSYCLLTSASFLYFSFSFWYPSLYTSASSSR